MPHKVQDTEGSWVYIIPVVGLVLTNSVKNELVINRVSLISIGKLSKVRKKFGIREKISELKKKEIFKKIFADNSATVAILRMSGKPSEITTNVIRLIVEELNILSVSQLGFSKRRFNSHPTIYSGSITSYTSLCMNTKDDSALLTDQLVGKIGDLNLDERWYNWQNDVFFITLLKILQNKITVSSSWRGSLYRASVLIGQSLTTNNLAQAFLLNMIAIESLLTRQGDKYTEILPKRIEAFIGWIGYWDDNNYNERIKGVYKKRCQYVHDGNDSKIKIEDLLFTDDLLLNIMLNLISHHKIFKSKEDIYDFTDKVSAEHVLGIIGDKSKIRPRTLRVLSKRYTDDDYKKI